MTLLPRRHWLALAASALAIRPQAGWANGARLPARIASPQLSHSQFVRNGLQQHFVPAAQAFASSSAALRNQLAQGCAPQPARDLWRSAMLDWERLSAVAVGPLLERRTARTLDFWPTRPAMVSAAVQSRPQDTAALDKIGAPATGLPALEWLLWQPTLDADSCAYAAVLATACTAEADTVLAAFQDLAQRQWTEETAFPVFPEWVGQAVGGLEQLRWKKIGKPARAARATDWPRATSRSTRASWQASWDGLQHFLVGSGRADELGSLNGFIAGDNQLPLSALLETAVEHTRARVLAADPARPASTAAAVAALAQARLLLQDKIAPELQTMVGFSDADGD